MGTIQALLSKADDKLVRKIAALERQKSEHWWKGIVLGFMFFFLAFGLIAVIPGTGIAAGSVRYLFALMLGLAWGLLMFSLFLDAKYVTEYSDWEPTIGLYLLLILFFPVVAPLAGAVYLFKRHRVVGVP